MIPYGHFGPHGARLSRRAWTGLFLSVLLAGGLTAYAVFHARMLPTVYLGSGIILAALYSSSGPTKRNIALLLAIAETIGLICGGMPPFAAAAVGAAITLQAWTATLILHVIAPHGLELSRLASIAKLGSVALAAAAAFGGLLYLFLRNIAPLPPEMFDVSGAVDPALTVRDLAGTWVLPHALGMLLAVPIFRGVVKWSCASTGRSLLPEKVATHAAVIIISAVVYFINGHSYIFLVVPLFVWTAIRLGICDTAMAVLFSLVVASVATALGHGPVVSIEPVAAKQVFFLDFMYLALLGSSIPIAATIEARQKLERALETSVAATRQIVQNVREIVFRTDSDGRWTYLNPAWEEMTGYSVDESLGWRTTRLLLPEYLRKAPELYAPLVSGAVDELNLQQRFFRKDGEIRDINVSVRAIRDQAGHFLGCSGIIHDATELRSYVRALETSERRFRALCDTAPVAIVRLDPEGMISYVNDRFELIALAPRNSLLGRRWDEAIRVDGAGIMEQLLASKFIPGSVVEREVALQDRSGLRRWVTLVATAEFTPDARLMGYIVAFADITQRKAAEAELAARTAQLKTLAENISDMVFRLNLDGTCLFATPSVSDILGLDPAALIGTQHFIDIHPDDQEYARGSMSTLRDGQNDQFVLSFRALPAFEGADYIWLEANCRMLRDRNGEPSEIMASIRDVTERKQLELELIDARKKAEAADRAKSSFLANLSHEIRTPMNGVIGLTELLLTRELDATSTHYVRLIAESGSTMMKLLNDILDIAKIESGRLQLANEAYDLHECLANSLSLMTASAAEKGLDLQLKIAPEVPRRIMGDSLRLRQILVNLIGNAVKFTSSGRIALEARVDGAEIEIEVIDTGIGIPAEALKSVFDEFDQGDATTAHKFGGTGLGLSISRRIAVAMSGSLSLSSLPGEGTHALLRIPCISAGGDEIPGDDRPEEIERLGNRALNVLVVEDNATNVIIITGMLQRLGCRTHSSGTGQDAIDAAAIFAGRGDPFDLVFLDLQLPDMDGFAVARILRERGFDAFSLPIIAVTANAFSERSEEHTSELQSH